jgi:anti-sigma regulatory factor (Ser/Thr protein kinase)
VLGGITVTGAMELSLQLRPDPSACTAARHAVRDFCVARGLAHLAQDAELLTSELVTNAIRHALAQITVRAVHRETSLLLNVTDDGVETTTLTSALAAPSSEHGRGLFVVNSVAGDWGVISADEGKTAWFLLP